MLNRLVAAGAKFRLEHRQILSNTGWLFSGRFFRILVSLFTATWVARYLGPSQFGALQYALAFSSFFLPLSTAQMDTIVTRDLVQQPEDKNQILGTAVVLQLIGGTTAALLSIVAILLVSPTDFYLQLLVAIVALKFVFNSLQPIESWFESQVNSKFTVLADNLAFILITLLKCSLILLQAPLFAFAIIISLETLIFAIGLCWCYQRNHQSILNWRTSVTHLKYLLKESLPLALSSTACIIYINVDRVMLGSLIGSHAVGIYSSAATLADAWWFLPTIVCSSLYPTIIQSKTLDQKIYRQRLQSFYDLISFLAYSLIILILPLTGWIINLLYGESYQSAVPVFTIYIWSVLFSFQGIAQSRWIVTEGLQKFHFHSRLAGLITNIVLNLILIPHYEGTGAAIATIVSYAIGNYLYFLFIPETRENALLMTKALCLPFRLPKLIKTIIHQL